MTISHVSTLAAKFLAAINRGDIYGRSSGVTPIIILFGKDEAKARKSILSSFL